MKVEIWSDVVCPWCHIGRARFRRALARFAHRDSVEVVWRSFELDPQAPEVRDGDYAERLAAKYGCPVEQARTMVDTMTAAAAAEGLAMDFSRVRSGNTFDAHRLLHLAAAQGRQDTLKQRLFEGYFAEGEAIGRGDVLARLAADAGLDAAVVHGVLAGDEFATDVRADEDEAAALGITGVPFFVVDRRYGVSGAQPPELLLEVLERAWAERQPAPIVTLAGPAGDGCDGDACGV